MPGGRDETRQGFTLIEMLAALAVAATAIAALAMAVGVTVATWSRGNTDAELVDTVGRAAARFGDDVASLIPWRFALGNEDRLLFSGDAREVIFAAIAQTGYFGQPRLRLVSYRAIRSPGGYTIQRRVARIPADPTRPGNVIWTEAVDLLTGVVTPRFAYSTPDQRGSTWTDTWQGGSILPRAVRLSFSVGDRPVIVDAAVMVDAERDCLLPASRINCTAKANPVNDKTEAAAQGSQAQELAK
jgi:general secretion pathway protein J